MNTMRFNDGVSFDTSGALRVEKRHDGYYVVGEGMLCPVDSYQEGSDMIKQMNERRQAQETHMD